MGFTFLRELDKCLLHIETGLLNRVLLVISRVSHNVHKQLQLGPGRVQASVVRAQAELATLKELVSVISAFNQLLGHPAAKVMPPLWM